MGDLHKIESLRLHRDRQSGYFKQSSALPASQLVVTVDVDTIEGEYREHDLRSSHYLAGWSATCTFYRDGAPAVTRHMDGVTSNQFWRWLHNRAVVDIPTWRTRRRRGSAPPLVTVSVLGANLSRTLPLLNTYQKALAWPAEFVSTGSTPSVSLVELVEGVRFSYRFVDIARIWDTTLEDLAKQLGLAQPVTARDSADIVAQAFRTWRKFIITNHLGRVAMSIGAQSMMSYRRFCAPKSLCLHTDATVLALERKACAGGYMAAMQTGIVGDCVLVDYRSAYVDAMRNPMPVKLVGAGVTPPLHEFYRVIDEGYSVVAAVTLAPHTPTLLGRCRRHTVNKLGAHTTFTEQTDRDFSRCRAGHKTVLTTPELVAVKGLIESVETWAVYRSDTVFSDWCQHIWRVRCNARDDFTRAMTKRLATALHGCFAYQPSVWTAEDTLDQWGGDFTYWWGICGGDCKTEGTHRHKYRQMLGRVERQDRYKEGANSMPAIYAHVTAHARLKLSALIETVGWGHTFYADTDGAIIDLSAESLIPADWFGNGLGELSRDVLRDVEIAAVKRYRYAGGARLSGLPSAGRVINGRWEFEEWGDWFPSNIESDGVAFTYTRQMKHPWES